VRVVEYPERLVTDPNSQPDSLTEDEVRIQKARSPHYTRTALAR
jgi:hypothetical protein